jgi:N-methylhydantoinase A
MTSYLIGVDTGGTFTDCVVVDGDGRITTAKAASTPPNFASGVIASLERAAESLGLKSARELLEQTRFFGHGTTVGTNALLTRTGAKTGLITTRGHEDMLFMGRIKQKVAGMNEDQLHDFLTHDKDNRPLVPRRLVRGLNERIDYKGAEIVGLDDGEVRHALEDLVEVHRCEAIAVCSLWSFMQPSHERRVAELARELYPDVAISLSSELAPVLGEYERCATTVINAYLSRGVGTYLRELDRLLRDSGLRSQLMIMLSNGGVASVEDAARTSAFLLSSGPAGGVIGARGVGRRLGFPNVLTTDVGGTSFDVGLVVDGETEFAREPVFDKYHLTFPMVDVVSIGAGGGSIAWLDADGFLKVGPQSAGADPGPACYGRGGAEPTATDANVVLGRINPDYFLGGTWRLDRTAAEAAIRARIAEPLGLSLEQAALGIIDILDARMADLVRSVTIGRGLDPREFALMAIGGAGPLHVGAYGRDAGVRAIVVPDYASEFSALGIATADTLVVRRASAHMVGPFSSEAIAEVLGKLEAVATADLRAAGADGAQVATLRSVDMRYKGQVHEVSVPIAAVDAERIVRDFHVQYERRYGKGTTNPAAPVEALSWEVRAAALATLPQVAEAPVASGVGAPEQTRRRVYFRGGWQDTPIHSREALQPGHVVLGPAVIEAPDTTILVNPDHSVRLDGFGNLLMELTSPSPFGRGPG